MSLLHDIQEAVLKEDTSIAPILLKLRLLASRLGSAPLEEWVRHESEGYPDDAPLPDYRIIGVNYTASFSGPFGSGIKNAPIPPYLIEKFAGERWNRHEARQSISAIDDLVKSAASGGSFELGGSSNLMLLLQGKVYPDYACNSITSSIAKSHLVELQHAVRSRVLELTIGLEKSLPASAEINLASRVTSVQETADRVTQITNQVVYGNVTSISSSGPGATSNVSIKQGDEVSFVDALVNAGIASEDAAEFGRIVASERPESKEEPFGTKAKAWLGDNLKKAATGAWKVGVTVATEVLKEAALRYYGLKP